MQKVVLGLLFSLLVFMANAQLNIETKCNQPDGWMPGGWGSYTIKAKNTGKDTVVITAFTLNWKGESEEKKEVNKKLAPGEEWKKNDYGYLPQDVVDKAGKKDPALKGHLFANFAGKEKKFPLEIVVPAAYLPEELQLIETEKAGMALMKSRFSEFKNIDRTMKWIDQVYNAMEDLTGGVPYDGKKIILKEAPVHPFWAYAGQEIILNTNYVGSTLKDFDNGLMSFGWVHEIGHDFDDGIGQWYNWSGPAAEWQANFKLCYAYETIEDQSFRAAQTIKVPNYPLVEKGKRLSGPDFTEKSFLYFGDKYLADSTRNWQTLRSDEMHCFFMRIQRMYGWDVYKGWYRTYRALNANGFKAPKKAEEKINIIAAILSKEAGVDLVPLFQTWKFPVSKEKVEEISKKYKL